MAKSDTDWLGDDVPRVPAADDDRPHRYPDDDKRAAGPQRSFFWPVVLITIGVVLLLSNLGVIAIGRWTTLLRLWPLLLVLAGLDLLFASRMPVVGTLLGLLMGGAVVLLLLFAAPGDWDDGWIAGLQPLRALIPQAEVSEREISVPREGADSLDLTLAPAQFGVRLHTEVGEETLLAGTLFYVGGLQYDVRGQGAERQITARHAGSSSPFSWVLDASAYQWDLGVQPDAALTLTVSGGSGPVDLALEDAALERLALAAGSGPVTLALPQRAVEASVAGGSGPLKLTVPTGGRLTGSMALGSGPTDLRAEAGARLALEMGAGSGPVTIVLGEDAAAELDVREAGSGPFTLELPRDAALRVVIVEGGSGPVSLPRELRQVSDAGDDDPDTGTWETDGYADATVRVLLRVGEMGSGPLRVRLG